MRSVLCLGVLLCQVAGQEPRLVRDINAGSWVGPSNPFGFQPLGPSVLFRASAASVGQEWFAATTAPGSARLVVDLTPGRPPSAVESAGVAGAHVYFTKWFSPSGSTRRYDLWRTDGTASGTVHVAVDIGPVLHADGTMLFHADAAGVHATDGRGTTLIAPGFELVRNTESARAGGLWFFPARSATHGAELLVTDGTQAGTRVLDIIPGPASSFARAVASLGSCVVFDAYDAAGDAIWCSDGTVAGTVRVAPGPMFAPRSAGAVAFFVRNTTGTVWRTDGTADGTFPLPVAVRGVEPGAAWLVELGNRALFAGFDPATGTEPWTSDGTVAGTRLLRDLAPGAASSSPRDLVVRGGRFWFVPDLAPGVSEIWTSDGTAAATNAAITTSPATGRSFATIYNLTAAAGGLFFAGDGEPMFADGSPTGTRRLGQPASGDSDPDHFTGFLGRAVFVADDGVTGREPWLSDGTAIGTGLLADLEPGAGSSSAWAFTVVDDRLFFVVSTAQHGTELAVSDGTPAGTQVLDLRADGSADPDSLVAWRGELWFGATADQSGHELWASDGTLPGTRRVLDVAPGPASGFGGAATPFLDELWFVGHDGSGAWGLYATDGTPAGTRRVDAPVLGYPMLARGRQLYFVGAGVGEPYALWVSDGTQAGTRRLHNLPGAQPVGFVDADPQFFLVMDGARLWSSDGTAAGTREVGYLYPHTTALVGNVVIFGRGDELWRSDGTASGTFLLTRRPSVWPIPSPNVRYGYAIAEGELIRTDGTVAGTSVQPLPTAGRGTFGLAAAGRLWLALRDPQLGVEPHLVDGGASAMPFGTTCSPVYGLPALRGTDPVVGASWQLTVTPLATSGAGVLYASLPATRATKLPGGCNLLLDPYSAAVLGAAAITPVPWSLRVPLPDHPALLGVELALQALEAPATGPAAIAVSNALAARLGR